jgi:cytosine/adenosine deaminase-related metal-dependent hydrolase
MPGFIDLHTHVDRGLYFPENRSAAHAVRSQTSLPADIMNWPDRGRIAEGAAADIVVLDLESPRL